MQKTILFIIIIYLYACKQVNKNVNTSTSPIDSINSIKKDNIKSDFKNVGTVYKFDSNAIVNGCGDVLLQKISNDKQYELVVTFSLDSLPKSAEIDIIKHAKFVSVYLNRYTMDNKHVQFICDDVLYKDRESKEPIKYEAINGALSISYLSDKKTTFTISAETKNLVLKSPLNDTITIPSEQFTKVIVGWMAG